ncbi:hypothetical protein [Wolbachia endosymbiont (group A) of Sphaerophoria taeniata]|uniref:hypothetical protein n=1 Tax=Wolbachia endosymbiont (group A) of Sphaerophoria taeniata TaxID=2954057 RepID=UPI00222646F1|nr:hypothetical protein [Wolbachia endosymbiont (group A) of Sphaerophoria taeniata]
MGKYTNAWFYKKDNHDCANDGTCGQAITDFRIGDSDIFFYDSNGTVIAQIPKLPNGNSITYRNNLYKTAQSKNFSENTKYVGVQDVLPNQFNFEYGKLNCVIHYDNVSQQEQEQMKLDIQNAYEAYKAKFCMDSDTQVTVHTYVFNNRDDYRGYGTLVPGFSRSQSSLNTSGGMTNGESVLLYKDVYTDNVLAHEFGHVFQFKLSEAKVEELDRINNQLMANAIGLEVEEKNYKAICKQMGVDEYKDHGSMFQFKYKDTTGSIYRKDLSEEEKFQIIQRVKNSGLDEYEDRGSMFKFKYKDTTGSIYRKDLSEEEKFQIIQRVKNSGLDEYEDRGSMFKFKYKDTTYSIYRKDLSEEEKFQFIQDIKNSHESLVSECDGLGNENTALSIYVDENKEISRMYFHNPDKNMSEWLDKTLISRSKSEEDVDDTDPKPGKEPEPESGKEPKEDISRSKPEQEVEKSNEVEQSNVDVEEEKSNQQDTQQPSNFLSSIIFPAIKSVIDSISSFFSWLFESKEEEQSDNNLSLLNLSEEQSDDNLSLLKPDVNHDADENYVGNYSDYHQHDDLI